MKTSTLLGILIFLFATVTTQADLAPPGPPTNPNDPGSLSYQCSFRTEQFTTSGGLEATLYLPTDPTTGALVLSPVVAFGHGHLVGLWGYQATFEHLAQKCIAVIFPVYDPQSFNSDFTAMGQNYLQITAAAVQEHPSSMRAGAVIFAGHSNGSRVALNAAALAQGQSFVPKALVLFSLPDYEPELISKIPAALPITLVVGDQDASKIITSSTAAYPLLPSAKKQYVTFRSYLQTTPQIIADHGMTRTASLVSEDITPLHYYGVWKYLVSAAFYSENGTFGEYIYGNQATSTGLSGFYHMLNRNFTTLP
jgi:pimeloyl-ACP methyl ester carboxylesterase